jgi:predicted nucleic-acid-binding protein
MKTILIDTNVILRFLLADEPVLYAQAKTLFLEAENQQCSLYIDEIVTAEVVWVLTSFYKHSREQVSQTLLRIFTQAWVVNPRKKQVLQALSSYSTTHLSFIDCWLLTLSKKQSLELQTFDQKLHSKANKRSI